MATRFSNIRDIVYNNVQQYLPYINKGLTFVSDNPVIVPRTKDGVIKVEENKPLIIEPTRYRISNRSVLKVVDTQFNFYNFPASINVQDLDSAQIEGILQETDPVYARYRPTSNYEFNASTTYSGIEFQFIEEGLNQKRPNTYYISKEIKDSGVDLRFRVKILHRYDPNSATFGTTYFSIIKNGPSQFINRAFRTFASATVNTGDTNYNGPSDGYGYIKQWEIQSATLNVVIPNSQFNTGDYFQIGAAAGQGNHSLYAVQSYWVITDASKNVNEWNQPIE